VRSLHPDIVRFVEVPHELQNVLSDPKVINSKNHSLHFTKLFLGKLIFSITPLRLKGLALLHLNSHENVRNIGFAFVMFVKIVLWLLPSLERLHNLRSKDEIGTPIKEERHEYANRIGQIVHPLNGNWCWDSHLTEETVKVRSNGANVCTESSKIEAVEEIGGL
jgi:hypothetical protein